jgi:hypothetical protein
VRYFVLEKAGFMTEPGAIRMFPLVWNWLQTNFRPVANFGFFDIWEKQEP